MGDRQLAPAVYLALKKATREFLDRSFRRALKVAGASTRVGPQAISDYANQSQPDVFMPVDVLLDLIDASGDTTLLAFIADQAGCLLVPLPIGEADDAIDAHTIRSAEDYARLVADLVRARTDGRVIADQRPALLRDIRALMRELAALAEAIREVAT